MNNVDNDAAKKIYQKKDLRCALNQMFFIKVITIYKSF